MNEVKEEMLQNLFDLAHSSEENFELAMVLAAGQRLRTKLIKKLSKNNNLTINDLKYILFKESVYLIDNSIDYLDICQNIQLLSVTKKNIKEIDLSSNKKIYYLSVTTYELLNLDVSNNVELRLMDCRNNKLITLDISKNTKLNYLDVSNNKLQSLDVSKNSKDLNLKCSYNKNLKEVFVNEYQIKNISDWIFDKHTKFTIK